MPSRRNPSPLRIFRTSTISASKCLNTDIFSAVNPSCQYNLFACSAAANYCCRNDQPCIIFIPLDDSGGQSKAVGNLLAALPLRAGNLCVSANLNHKNYIMLHNFVKPPRGMLQLTNITFPRAILWNLKRTVR